MTRSLVLWALVLAPALVQAEVTAAPRVPFDFGIGPLTKEPPRWLSALTGTRPDAPAASVAKRHEKKRGGLGAAAGWAAKHLAVGGNLGPSVVDKNKLRHPLDEATGVPERLPGESLSTYVFRFKLSF